MNESPVQAMYKNIAKKIIYIFDVFRSPKSWLEYIKRR